MEMLRESERKSFEKVGVQIYQDHLSFIPFVSVETTDMSLESLESVTLKKTEMSFAKKALYWLQRISIWNRFAQRGLFDDETDYQGWYDLNFIAKDRSQYQIRLRDFDVIGLKGAIDSLNQQLEERPLR